MKIAGTTEVIKMKVVEGSGGGGGKLPNYTGDYTVTPKVTETKLLTKNKSMTDDVTVFQIPYSDVINESGGHTITIGLE